MNSYLKKLIFHLDFRHKLTHKCIFFYLGVETRKGVSCQSKKHFMKVFQLRFPQNHIFVCRLQEKQLSSLYRHDCLSICRLQVRSPWVRQLCVSGFPLASWRPPPEWAGSMRQAAGVLGCMGILPCSFLVI